MKAGKLFELLTLVNGVTSTQWETVRRLVDIIGKGSVTIKEKKWNDHWKQQRPEYHPLNLAEINTWSTFDDTCIDLYFSNDTARDNGHPNNQLVCHAKIYDGESFGGHRKQLRFEALLWLPTAFLHTIEKRIEWKFQEYLEDAYANHLEAQKILWINNMKQQILETTA